MDPSQLHQALLNLCINARDAMAGTGKLDIDTTLIDGRDIASRFPAAEGKRLIRIQVSDTGVGMDEKTRARIFEPFFTTKGRRPGHRAGTGRGLRRGEGAQGLHRSRQPAGPGHDFFALFLGIGSARRPCRSRSTWNAEPIARGSETILVVEDEESLRELLTSVLHDYGYGILVARDGMEALERYRRHRDRHPAGHHRHGPAQAQRRRGQPVDPERQSRRPRSS